MKWNSPHPYFMFYIFCLILLVKSILVKTPPFFATKLRNKNLIKNKTQSPILEIGISILNTSKKGLFIEKGCLFIIKLG